MKLKKLTKNLNYLKLINFNGDNNISGLYNNRKNVLAGGVYFCINGTNVDGHNFANSAVESGATVLVVERYLDDISDNVTQILVKNCRLAMAQMAKTFYHNACDSLKVVGVVGTNGKTSTSLILQDILEKQGYNCAVIGTDGVVAKNYNYITNMTTPDPIILHKIMLDLKKVGVEVVVLEVSAQAIYFHKVFGIKFHSAVLTNISPEHLDFFENYEQYANTKLNFFSDYKIKNKIFNSDCKEALTISESLKMLNEHKLKNLFKKPLYFKKRAEKNISKAISETSSEFYYDYSNVLTYGIAKPSDIFAIDIKISIKGTEFIVNAKNSIYNINTKLIGIFNVYNILAAISLAKTLNCNDEVITKQLNNYKNMKGRFDVMHLDCNNKIIIDFAHTEKAFEEVLSITKKLRPNGKIITIFGCVGYSSFNKRKNIGEIAGKYSDEVILTADNPNYTPITSINSDIIKGINKYNNVIVHEEDDRKLAIELGVSKLSLNDTLLILGKGNEKFNKIMGENILQNDFNSVNSAIEKCYNFKKSFAESIE